MKIKVVLSWSCAMIALSCAYGDVGGSAMSSSTDIDLTVGIISNKIVSVQTIPVEFGSLYGDVEGVEAQFLVNGDVIVSGGEAATVDWKPTDVGTYELVHRTLIGGIVTGTVLSVTYVVTADMPKPIVISSVISSPIALDLVADAVSYVLAEGETVPVEYGALYGDVEAGQAQLILNGAIMRTGGWASVYDLKPAVTGVFDLVHRMVDNGVVTGTVLLARIEVTALGGVYVMPVLEDPTEDEIKEVLVVARDANLVRKITTEAAYTNFSAWAKKVQPHGGGDPVGAAGVMAAPNAWLSYALGSEVLIEKALTNGQMRVEAFAPSTNSSDVGKFDFTVSIEDVAIGGAATTEAQKEQVKENLKRIFGLEGGTSPSGLSSDSVDITFGKPEDGKVKFTAGPKDTDAPSFFMKVKMQP